MSKEFVLIKVGADLPGKAKAGDVVKAPVNLHGTVRDHYWRRRLRDAQTERLRDPEYAKDCDEGKCETCVRIMTDKEVEFIAALAVTEVTESQKQSSSKGNKKSAAKAVEKE